MAELIRVQVAYLLCDRQELRDLTLHQGATVQDAIEQSGLMPMYPEIDLVHGKFGVYAKLCKPGTVLRDRDRVEIYRPLIADPKKARRQRAIERNGKTGSHSIET